MRGIIGAGILVAALAAGGPARAAADEGAAPGAAADSPGAADDGPSSNPTMRQTRSQERVLDDAARNEAEGEPKAKLYKMLGVLQFALGKPAEAKASLSKALALDPKLTLSKRETVDEKVLDLFTALGGHVVVEAPVADAAPGPVPPDPTLDAAFAGEARALEAAAQAQDAGGKRRRMTSIQVDADVIGANIFVDGILVGAAGDEIDVDAGPLVIEVGAAGYKTQKLRFRAAAGAKTTRKVRMSPETGAVAH